MQEDLRFLQSRDVQYMTDRIVYVKLLDLYNVTQSNPINKVDTSQLLPYSAGNMHE
jgi:hypothetical protein